MLFRSVSTALQAVAVIVFSANRAFTRAREGSLTWPTGLIFLAMGWWVLAALAEPAFFLLSHQEDPEAAILFVARWAPIYRQAQFAGFVAMMIFGVALMKLPECFGVSKPYRTPGVAGAILWNAGLIGAMLGWLRYFGTGMDSEARGLLNEIGRAHV